MNRLKQFQLKFLFSTDLTIAQTPSQVVVSANATCLTSGAQVFNVPVIYTVQAEDLSTQAYTALVTKAAPSSACNITDFKLGLADEKVVINEASKTISVTIGASDNITNITPTTITKSTGATMTSPTFPTDFTNPVAITVRAEDGTTKTYTVIATKDVTAPTFTTNPASGRSMDTLGGLLHFLMRM